MTRECKHRCVEAIFDLSSSRSQSGGAKNVTGFGTYIIVAVSEARASMYIILLTQISLT
jgi:hypothetical protein